MRPFKVDYVRTFLTEFDGTQETNKVREEGAETSWQEASPTVFKTSHWWTRFDNNESLKESRYTETDPAKVPKWLEEEKVMDRGEREGSNSFG